MEDRRESQQPWVAVSSKRKPTRLNKITPITLDDMFHPKKEEFIVSSALSVPSISVHSASQILRGSC